MTINQTNNNRGNVVNADQYAALLYVLDVVRHKCGKDDVLHTRVGGRYHDECLRLEKDGLVLDISSNDDKRLGVYQWEVA